MWEILDQRKDVENEEKYDGMCDKCCDADGEISTFLDICKELHRDVHYHPIYSRHILMP